MNFRTLAASVGPRGRLLAFLAATALAVPFSLSGQAPTAPPPPPPHAPPPPKGRPEGHSRRPGAARSSSRSTCSGAAAPRTTGPGAGSRSGRPAAAGPGAADLCTLDQILPEGTGRQRQAGLLHRQGRPHRVRPT